MDGLLSPSISSAALLPISNAAAIVTALLGPTPLIWHSISVLIRARSHRCPPPAFSISRATSITFAPPRPVLNSIARSSVSVSVSAPLCRSLSLGISSFRNSFSLISFKIYHANISCHALCRYLSCLVCCRCFSLFYTFSFFYFCTP